MMKINFKEIEKEIKQNREKILEGILRVSVVDMLLFWSEEEKLVEQQTKYWQPVLDWAESMLDTRIKKTRSLDVPEQSKESGHRIRKFLESLSDKEMAAFYVAGTETKSVLLSAALIKGVINPEQAFKAAFLEEHWQQEKWGSNDEIKERQNSIKDVLEQVVEYLGIK